MVLTFVYLIIVFFIAQWLQFNAYQIKLLLLLALMQILNSFVLYLRSNISALQFFRTDSFLSILDRALAIVFCSIIIWGNYFQSPIRIEWFIYAQITAYFIAAITSLMILLHYTSGISFTLNWSSIVSIIKQGYPFSILILLMGLYHRIDAIMIERLLVNEGAKEAGIYASAYRLIDALNIIGLLFGALLLPMFSKMLKQHQPVEDLVSLSFKLIFFFSVTCGVTGYFFQKEIMESLYREANDYSSLIFGILMFAFIAIANVYIFGTLLTANNNLKILNLIAASGVLMNVLLNYWLIREYKALGAAVSAMITQTAVILVEILVVQYIFKFKINIKFLFKLIIFISVVVLINYSLKDVFYNWKINFSAVILLSFFLALMLRLVNIKNIILLFKEAKN